MEKQSKMKSCFLFSIAFPIFLLCACCEICLADCDNMQDICPTDTSKKDLVFINGFPCKNPDSATVSDFKNSKLTQRGDTDNLFRSAMTIVTAEEYLGLNTLGLSIGRIDISVDGIVPPHSHPRSSEIIFVNKGFVIAGFIDTKGNMFNKLLKEGDVFVFPKGLLHFSANAGVESAATFSVFNSQNPGVVSITDISFQPGVDVIKSLARKLMVSTSTLNVTGN